MNDYTSDSRSGDTREAPNPGTGARPSAGAGRPGRPPLRRAYDRRMLAGVAAGVADYLNIDVTIIRIAFAAATLLGGAGIPAYLACVLLIPEEGSDISMATEFLDSLQSR